MLRTLNTFSRDEYWMQQALQRAQKAAQVHEVPVGALLILENEIIGEGWNQPITACDPSAHAEIIALRQGAHQISNYRLLNSTLYVTLEPCVMCVGAILQARIRRLVYGATDEKAGAVASAFHLLDGKPPHSVHNHRIEWEGGCLKNACGAILKEFFQIKRT